MRASIFWISMYGLMSLLPNFFQTSAIAGGISFHEKLIDTEWQWKKSRYNNDTEAVPDDREKYSITFGKDGSFWGQADCNKIRGKYSVSDSQIVIDSIVSTRVVCPPESLDRIFLKDIGRLGIIFFKDNRLYIDLQNHSGTMTFTPAQGVTEKGGLDNKETEPLVCQDPRPEVCTMEYDPVCGKKSDGSYKTYSNGCTACSDPDVMSYCKGQCQSEGTPPKTE